MRKTLGDNLNFMAKRAHELEADEGLHRRLPLEVAAVVGGKRLMLLQELAEAMGHPDLHVVCDLARGYSITGVLSYSGAFPRRGPRTLCAGTASHGWRRRRRPRGRTTCVTASRASRSSPRSGTRSRRAPRRSRALRG